jgi:membrane-associated phospholipid phosphatase
VTPAATILAALLAVTPAASSGAARSDEPIYTLNPVVDGTVMVVSALTIGIPALFAEDLIRKSCPCDPSSVNAFDRHAIGNDSKTASHVSDVTVTLAMVGPPVATVFLVRGSRALVTDLLVFGEVLLVNGALTQIAKYTVQRPLPLTYAGDPALIGSAGGYRSFYSGHTSSTFAALSAGAFTLRQRSGDHVWPWLVVAGVGASVAAERVLAGRHFPTDVIVGAAMGTLVGVGVPWLHLTTRRVALLPSRRGLAVSMAF